MSIEMKPKENGTVSVLSRQTRHRACKTSSILIPEKFSFVFVFVSIFSTNYLDLQIRIFLPHYLSRRSTIQNLEIFAGMLGDRAMKKNVLIQFIHENRSICFSGNIVSRKGQSGLKDKNI